MRKLTICISVCIAIVANAVFAQSNIDNTVPNKFGWAENLGWTNWRDANGAVDGVAVGPHVMTGYIWAENAGWINVGDGTPGSFCAGLPCYDNVNGTDFGVNIDPDGDLHGYAWGENIGWINFDGGAMASPPQPARIACASLPGQPLARLTGYAWAENKGWINLSVTTAGQFVAVDTATTPIACDMNHDGVDNGRDIQLFVNFLLATAAPNWRDVCSGDVENTPDRSIDPGDVVVFVNCLLN